MVKNKTRIFPKDFSKTRNGENVGSSGFRRFSSFFPFYNNLQKEPSKNKKWRTILPETLGKIRKIQQTAFSKNLGSR
jgi:hypothetical protein